MTKPDFSKLKVNSLVTFEAKKSHVLNLILGHGIEVFPHQIIAIKPPPANWDSVKPGDRFLYGDVTMEEYVWYIGPCRQDGDQVFVENQYATPILASKSDLTPAPESEGDHVV